MRTTAIYNLVFNRKKENLEADETALIQVEVLLPVKGKKYIGTNVYVKKSQWDRKTRRVKDTGLDVLYNDKLKEYKDNLVEFEHGINSTGRMITAADIDFFVAGKYNIASFYDYMIAEINKRSDITVGTRGSHTRAADRMKLEGIVKFSDLTFANIKKLDDAMRSEGKEQPTIHKYHKHIKTYIHLAEKAGYLEYGKSPYLAFEVSKGKHKIRQRLDDAEIMKVLNTRIEDPVLNYSRDLFAFTMFTGITHEDTMKLTPGDLRELNNGFWIENLRKKNGEYYSVFLLPFALNIVQKYRDREWLFPAKLQLYAQNRNLKIVGAVCGIQKKLSTYVGRHTFATMCLRNGVRLKTISEMLGHTRQSTTEIYAKLEKQVIADELQQMKIIQPAQDGPA